MSVGCVQKDVCVREDVSCVGLAPKRALCLRAKMEDKVNKYI